MAAGGHAKRTIIVIICLDKITGQLAAPRRAGRICKCDGKLARVS